jgi:hypothetical protein
MSDIGCGPRLAPLAHTVEQRRRDLRSLRFGRLPDVDHHRVVGLLQRGELTASSEGGMKWPLRSASLDSMVFASPLR